MLAIHFVERNNELKRVNPERNIWTSGFWKVSQEKAERMKAENGSIYLHEYQADPSKFGGQVIDYEIVLSGELAGRIVFTFVSSMDYKDVRAPRANWGPTEKLYVGFADDSDDV